MKTITFKILVYSLLIILILHFVLKHLLLNYELNNFNQNQLNLLKSLFDVYSDNEIYDILTNKSKPKPKFKILFEKINNL